MTSEIVNRTVPARSFWFMNHLVAKALHLADNGRDKLIKAVLDGAGSCHRQIDGIGNQAEQRHRGRVAVDKTSGVKQIRNPYLVGREAVMYRIPDVGSIESNQCSRWAVGTNGVDEDHVVRFRKQSQKRKAKRAAIFQTHARGDAVVPFHAGDCGGT